MSNTICCSSLDDLPVEILTRIVVMLGLEFEKDIIYTMYVAWEESEVFKEASLHMFEGMGPKDLNVDVFIHKWAAHKNVDAMYRQGVLINTCL
uniref:Uncharacterized protein n=1 Tax=Lactuca sativa TaxID=4236 RepID=A0A9R1W1J6_LACSA|nr:hypothetical protein LSAT_V11C400185720 [Lactuca sativa]